MPIAIAPTPPTPAATPPVAAPATITVALPVRAAAGLAAAANNNNPYDAAPLGLVAPGQYMFAMDLEWKWWEI